jgi:hypothetical protein
VVRKGEMPYRLREAMLALAKGLPS